jgi:hypothetical protein
MPSFLVSLIPFRTIDLLGMRRYEKDRFILKKRKDTHCKWQHAVGKAENRKSELIQVATKP